MRGFLLLLLAGALLEAKDNALTAADVSDGWLLLFDGASSMGWTQGKTNAWRIADGAWVFDGQQAGLLGSAVPFADFTLRFSFRAANPNKIPDLLVRYGTGDTPEESGYLIKLSGDDAKWPTGSIVSVGKADGSAIAANQWHSVEIEAAGDKLSVNVDGRKIASGKDQRGKAGFIGFLGRPGESIQIRNVRLKPESWQNLFNGTDLSNWRAVTMPPPKPAGGIKKMLKFGSAKPKDAQWTVQAGAVHVEGGPGELQTQAQHGDLLVQVQVRSAKRNKEDNASVRLRADAGQWGTGYAVELLPPDAGELIGFKAPRSVPSNTNANIGTIAAAGRHFLVWINGYPVSEFEDTRPEGASIAKGAKSGAGAISLATNTALDIPLVRGADIASPLGLQKAAAASAPIPVAVAPAIAAPAVTQVIPPVAPTPGLTPQQQEDEKTKADVKRLTAQALQETDPQKLVNLYGQILQADPDNAFAANGIRDARTKLEQAAQQQQQAVQQQSEQQHKTETTQAQGEAALHQAGQAFDSGDLASASGSIRVAQKLLPGNPAVEKLRQGIERAIKMRQRLTWLASGAALVTLCGLSAVVVRKRGKKVPVLVVVDGLEKGKRFRLDAEINHIGAVGQDGNARNEIVLRDVDRMISRFHCEIFHKNGKLFLIDVGSANGTFVKGRRIPAKKPLRLKTGRRVNLARVCDVELEWDREQKA